MEEAENSYWADVPADLLETIGSHLTFDRSAAAWRRVCKRWAAGLAAGVPALSLSVPPGLEPCTWEERMAYLAAHFPGATCYRLDVTPEVEGGLLRDRLAGVAWRCQRLQELQLAFQSRTYEMDDAEFGAISTIPGLRVLGIVGGSYETTRDAWEGRERSPIRRLSAAQQLQQLKFVPNRGGVWNADLHALASLTGLCALELKVKAVSDAGLAALGRLQRLQALTLHHLWLHSQLPAQLTGQGLAGLAGLAALLTLQLSVVNLQLAEEGQLAALAEVRSLGLRARAPTVAGVHRLCTTCRANLTRLELEHVGLEDSSLLTHLSQLPRLDDLRLSLHNTSRQDVHLHLTTLGGLPLRVFHLRLAPNPPPAPHGMAPAGGAAGRLLARLDAAALGALARSWGNLASLSLHMDPCSFPPGSLWVLGSFASLESLSIFVTHHPQPPYPPASSAPHPNPSSSLDSRPVQLWLCSLPPKLLHLHLHNVELLPPINHPLYSPSHAASRSHTPPAESAPHPTPGLPSLPSTSTAPAPRTPSLASSTLSPASKSTTSSTLSPAAKSITSGSHSGSGSMMGLAAGVMGCAASVMHGAAGVHAGAPRPQPSSFSTPPASPRTHSTPATPPTPPTPTPAAAGTPTAAGRAAGQPPAGPMAGLLSLHLDFCSAPRHLLPALWPHLPSLSSLRLHEVHNMDDSAIAQAAQLSGLTGLTVYAPISPRNHAVTQASLARLAPSLGRLRELRWVSFDMALAGPKVEAFATFAALKSLVLMSSQVSEAAAEQLRCALRQKGNDAQLQLVSRFEMLDCWHTAFWTN